MTTLAPIGFPLHQDPLDATVEQLLQTHADTLPNLSHINLLCANSLALQPLREKLTRAAAQRGYPALLGPELNTLDQWLENFPPPAGKQPIPAEHRLLMLANVLQKLPALYGASDAWHLAEDLLIFFDQLTEQQIQLPDNEQAFTTWLASLYDTTPTYHNSLQKEAHIILTLWHAWHTQLDASGFCDAPSLKAFRLSRSLETLQAQSKITYLLGFAQLSPALTQWAEKLHANGQLHILQSGNPTHGLLCNDPQLPTHSQFYNTCYDYLQQTLPIRAATTQQQIPTSPLQQKLSTLAATSQEQQAEAIVLLAHQALQRGEKSVAIITEDRRLARRVRALLERHQITLHDNSGWALSTTQAATTIENWLRCLEADFPHLAFLDLLKSPFLKLLPDRDAQLELVYRLEQDIILHENIAEGLQRYRHALQRRMARLTNWNSSKATQLQQLLTNIHNAAAHITPYTNPKQKTRAHTLLTKIIDNLNTLNIMPNLQQDAAGQLITHLLQNLQHASAQDPDLQWTWLDFRTCTGRLLESTRFIPPTETHDLYLLNLTQSHLLSFDSIILAAASEHHLPGEMQPQTFFNDTVRKNLGLPDWQQRYTQRAQQFRALLERSRKLTFTWTAEENGELLRASPWVSALEHFHETVYGISIRDTTLIDTINQLEQDQQRVAETTISIPTRPQPACDPNLLPQRLSVSAYQRLINCPYQFHVSDILRLKPIDEIRETMQKSDYGNRIHACLQAFHTDIPHLPGPFQLPLTELHRQAACQLLQTITDQIFSQDIEDNFQHRGWYKRWGKCIPAYIDWEIQRHTHWNFTSAEQTAEINLGDITLYGRIDRIDHHQNHLALIDYKTGNISSREKVLQGEDIQLSSYALMLPNATQIEYLSIGHDATVTSKTIIQADHLTELRTALEHRTKIVIQMLAAAAALPAWADPESCQHCHYAGLCRRHAWQDQTHPSPPNNHQE